MLNFYSYSILEAGRGIDYYYDDYYDENEDISDHKEEVRIDCDTKNLPNNTIEEIFGKNVSTCCAQKGYIFQKFRKVYQYTLKPSPSSH